MSNASEYIQSECRLKRRINSLVTLVACRPFPSQSRIGPIGGVVNAQGEVSKREGNRFPHGREKR